MPGDYLDKYDVAGEAAASISGKIKDFSLAASTDFVTTFYNSTVGLLPGVDDVRTEDVLARTDKDSLAFFNEHKEGVQAASFLAGVAAPGLATVKLLNRAKAGVASLSKGSSILADTFSGAKAEKYQLELRSLMEESKYNTSAYSDTMRKLYAAKVGEQFMDATIFEGVTVATLNAHPYMEDYMQTPYSNFALWGALGGAIGSVGAAIGVNHAVRTALGAVEKESIGKVLGKYDSVDLGATSAEAFQKRNINISNLESLLQDTTQNQRTRDYTVSALTEQRAERENQILKAASWLEELKGTEKMEMRGLVTGILGDPRFVNVQKVRLPSLSGITKDSKGALPFDDTTQLLLKDDEGKSTIAFFRPSSGELFDKTGARSAGRAVDIKGFKVSEMNLSAANNDFLLEAMSRLVPTAKIDAQYLNELSSWSKVNEDKLKHITIAPNDLPRQNAAVRWLAGQSQEVRGNAKFFVTSEQASHREVEQFFEKGGAGVKPTYLKDVETAIRSGKFDYEGKVSAETSSVITAWIHGGAVGNKNYSISTAISKLRQGFTDFFTSNIGDGIWTSAAREMWNKGAPFREEMKKHADADGYVYLFRGSQTPLKHHTTVESYTIKQGVATNFNYGDALPRKVHVDNIIGTFGGKGMGEMEILVTSPHTQVVNDIPVLTAENKIVNIPSSGQNKNVMNTDQLIESYHRNVEDAVQDMMMGLASSKGSKDIADYDMSFDKMAFEEIAAKLNLTKEATIAIAAGTPLNSIPSPFRYTDANKITSEYLNPKNKMLMLAGNPHKLDMALVNANLDNRILDTAHQQMVQFITAQSDSSFGKALMNLYSPISDTLGGSSSMMAHLQLLKQNIGEINNLTIGSPFFQTMDNALRRLGEGGFVTFVGKEVTNIKDKLIETHVSRIAMAFAALRGKDTAIIEAEVLRNKLLSLTGWREIRTEKETGLGYIVQRENRTGGEITEVPVREKDGSTFYIRQPEVVAAFNSMREAAKELYSLHNLRRKILGQKSLNDLGDYIPPPSLVGKYISRVIDVTGTERVKLLYANSEEELRGLEAAYKSEVISSNPQYRIVTGHGKELNQFNIIQQYNDGEMFVTFANNELKHGGSSATAVIKPDARGINEMIEGWEHQINAGMNKFHALYLDDVFQKLDTLSNVNQKFIQGQPVKEIFKKRNDAALTVKNALMGLGNINQSVIWKGADDVFSMMTQVASDSFSNTVRTFKGKVGTPEYFEQLNKDMAAVGMKNPWESYDLYAQSARASSSPAVTRRATSAATGLMATFQLRLADAAFAAVNVMSLPVLLHSSLMETLPKTTLGNGSKITLPLRLMYDAVRFRFNPEGKALLKEWEEAGRLGSPTRQYVDLLGKIHSPIVSKDASDEVLSAIEGFQKSKAVELLSKPADFTESLTREIAMLSGYLGAKHAYPGISKTGASIHAVSTADRAIGNYYSSQRPVLFQGSLGSMLGLYQTYLMSFAQSVYRGIENKQFVQLTQTALLQAGLFGTSSWPGYSLLSEFVGKHLSNQNYDLTTGTYRAVGDTTAELILYGLPSWLGPSFYTRGDVTPRVPTIDNLAIVNGVTGIYNTMGRMVNGLTSQPGLQGKLQSVGEALSLQTMSRPIARASELLTGESITSKGQTVANSNDVWTPMGIFSRLMAVRPLEEQVTRNAMHLNSYYGAVDYAARQEAVGKIRTAIRSGDMPDELLDKVAQDYLHKGGSAKGWNDVMNTIMLRTEEGTRMDLMKKLEPDSPLRRMIKENF